MDKKFSKIMKITSYSTMLLAALCYIFSFLFPPLAILGSVSLGLTSLSLFGLFVEMFTTPVIADVIANIKPIMDKNKEKSDAIKKEKEAFKDACTVVKPKAPENNTPKNNTLVNNNTAAPTNTPALPPITPATADNNVTGTAKAQPINVSNSADENITADAKPARPKVTRVAKNFGQSYTGQSHAGEQKFTELKNTFNSLNGQPKNKVKPPKPKDIRPLLS